MNTENGGYSFATNTFLEKSHMFVINNQSLELIHGVNKLAFTHSSNISFRNREFGKYEHGYIRTIPTALLLVAAYYTSGVALSALAVA